MITRRIFAAAGAAVFASGMARAGDGGLTGSWTGALRVGVQAQRVRLDVAADDSLVFTSVDQNGVQRPGRVSISADGAVSFEVKDVGVIVGRRTGDDRIEGALRVPAPGRDPVTLPLVLVRGAALASAAPAAPSLTQAGLEALRRGCGAPALAAAAQRRGGATKVWATGVRMAGAATPVMPADQWHLGSISKSFLATLVARLVDRDQLAWDDTLGAAIAADGQPVNAPYRDATFLHLMSHRAGITRDLPLHQMRAFDASTSPERAQRKAFLQSAFALPPVAPLGTRSLYSNIGYVAAAAMIEARTGRDWESLMRQEVFAPLGLKSAGFGPPGRKGALTEPVGHGPFFEQPYRPHPVGAPNDDLPLVMGPAGRVHMSLPDLITYLAAHRDRTSLLKPATWDVLHTPHFDGGYALGWNVSANGDFTHDGSNLLWYAVVSFNSRTGLAAAAAANDGRTSVWGAVGEAGGQALSAV
jgi:CubicO group peptidase (beta-lactamase class C family)